MSQPSLHEKIVVITGAGGRLGQRMMERFAELGATLVAINRSPVDLPDGADGRSFEFDATDEEAVATCFQQVAGVYGRVDVLVHTVGTWDGRPFLETSLDDWGRIIRINLTSAFLCFREAARLMQEHGGRLIGIASGQGADQGQAEQGAYSAAKAGVVRLVEAVAGEFTGTGITAHAIAPSFILYDEDGDQDGVSAARLVDLAVTLSGPAGDALNGAVLRAYGTLR